MRISVTGGSGKIGANVVRTLRAAGHDVTSIDSRPAENSSPKDLVTDLRDRDAVRAAIDGCEAVVHLGEMANIFGGDWHRVYAHNTHVGSLVMELAAECRVAKLIYTSSCQVYGCWGGENGILYAPLRLPLDETHPLNPANSYALSKVANEHYARLVAERTGMRVAAFRLPYVMTEAQHEKQVEWRLARREPVIIGQDGLGTTLHVDDAASAYAAAITAEWTGFEPFHFTAPDVFCDRPVRDVLQERYPHLPLPADWPANKSPVVTDKAQRMLGWTARHSAHRRWLLRRESDAAEVA
ncbi:MAG: NAD-dependent epimerase/dehydratase [Phycisphaerales bacterium]|nr:NAD-dependent epimerase/dehydratase [Phycisphaerales bacterium]